MGPTGAGKSTVGRALAGAVGWPFADSGNQADGQDRRQLVVRAMNRREALVMAYAGLKASDRDLVRAGFKPVRFVYLKAPRAVLEARLAARHPGSHPAALHAELLTLEDPGDTALTLDASLEPAVIVEVIRRELGL